MPEKRVAIKSVPEKRKISENLQAWISGLVAIASSLVGLVLSVSVSQSKSPKPEVLYPRALVYFFFFGGIVLLTSIVVGIANLMRRKNRGAILLKQRLSEIYLSALRRSAFNPQLESLTSDE